jgi:hypothetical protein
MVDKAGLQIIGYIFGGTTALVLLVAVLLVGNAIAMDEAGAESPQSTVATISPLR